MQGKAQTELVLQAWRFGSTIAERLCADILVVQGFESIDPQAPLGGRDGLKDVICVKGGIKWVAAAYFPSVSADYKEVKKKFTHDLAGVKKNGANGFIFFTNQRLKLSERTALQKLASPYATEIYHVERIRNVLDTPRGYGLRLEYLGIPMSIEDQSSLWSASKDDLTKRLMQQAKEIQGLHRKMDTIMARTMTMSADLAKLPSTLSKLTSDDVDMSAYPTSTLTLEQVLWLQRILLGDDANARAGIRSVEVWIGGSGSSRSEAIFVPVAPLVVPEQLEALLAGWSGQYPTLLRASTDTIIEAIARFHYGFLHVHPFIDGNGRVARSLLQQQVRELLQKDIFAIFTDDPGAYYESLRKANDGDMAPLVALIEAAIE